MLIDSATIPPTPSFPIGSSTGCNYAARTVRCCVARQDADVGRPPCAPLTFRYVGMWNTNSVLLFVVCSLVPPVRLNIAVDRLQWKPGHPPAAFSSSSLAQCLLCILLDLMI